MAQRTVKWWGPVLVAAVVAVLVLAASGDRESDDATSGHELEQPATVERVAHRVEAIRGHRFKSIPEVKILSEDEIAFEQEAQHGDLSPKEKDAQAKAEREGAAGLEAAKIVGLLPAGFDPGQAGGAAGTTDLIGVYDYKNNTIRLVDAAVERDPKLAEAGLAHELNHALETQVHGARLDRLRSLSERSLAYLALQEGVAILVEAQYAKRHLAADVTVREVLDRSSLVRDDPKVPAFIEDTVAFPYRQGGLFADSLLRDAGGNDFRLIDEAQRRPPVSSAQILHPELWKRNVKPVPVALQLKPVLGAGWRRLGGVEFGEFDTAALMRLGGTRDQGGTAAEGWAGGRYELWRRGEEECEPPCRDHSALVIGWRWANADHARQQEELIEPYVQLKLKPRAGSDGTWRLSDGWVVYQRSGKASALAFAPSREQAQRIAQEGTGGQGE